MKTPQLGRMTPIKIAFIIVGLIIAAVAANIGLKMLQPYLTMSSTDSYSVSPERQAVGAMAMEASSSRGMIAPSPIMPPINIPAPAGEDAENFEVKSYNAYIEAQNFTESCQTIADLKQRSDVIFENANTGDTNCSFTFKVAGGAVESVLATLRGMNPKDLSENVYTIKRTLSQLESEEEILKKKGESIDKSLNEAITAYDEIASLARSEQDAESLTKLITSKLELVERLTSQKIQNNAQITRLEQAKTEQEDQLKYTNFSVSIVKDVYFDAKDLGESWEQALKNFIQELNMTAQNLTVGVLLLFALTLQYGLYFVILLFVAKYGWKFTKRVWKE